MTFLSIEKLKYEIDFNRVNKHLTLDVLYRGRFEKGNELHEIYNGKGYMYMEFIEECRLEFLSSKMLIEILK